MQTETDFVFEPADLPGNLEDLAGALSPIGFAAGRHFARHVLELARRRGIDAREAVAELVQILEDAAAVAVVVGDALEAGLEPHDAWVAL